MKKILLITTGGTIASIKTEEGLLPSLSGQQLISYIADVSEFCTLDTYDLFSIDSTNMAPKYWLQISKLIEEKYDQYDGFVICHGTDTMAYSASALSYLIQNSLKPIVITGSQKPINMDNTDGKTNLYNSILFSCDERAYGVNICFDGKIIKGTRAKKEFSKSYNAFTSINYPLTAIIQDGYIVFYIDDKNQINKSVKFYHSLNSNIFLLKLIPGVDLSIINVILDKYDGLIIESFGVGGLPSGNDGNFYKAIKDYLDKGKVIVMATQVTHEGSDMEIYQVGKLIKEQFDLVEAFDMTLEATITKTMWALANSSNYKDFKKLFYTTIDRDILFTKGK